VEAAQEAVAYEPEEDETFTATVIKKVLKDLIDDLQDSTGQSARRELANLQAQEKAITAVEKRIKETKAKLRLKADELELKLQLKRLGSDEFKEESLALLQQIDGNLANLDEKNKDDKKEITALNRDKTTLNARMAKADAMLTAIGGQLTEDDTRKLILKKLYDLAAGELSRYLNAEKRAFIARIENLWNKYAVSSRELENERTATLKTLNNFLKNLGYLKEQA